MFRDLFYVFLRLNDDFRAMNGSADDINLYSIRIDIAFEKRNR